MLSVYFPLKTISNRSTDKAGDANKLWLRRT